MRSSNPSPISIALAAMPCASTNARVFRRVCVALWAMGFGGLVTSAQSTSSIFETRNRLQVARVYAAANTAQVINLESRRDRAYEQFIAHAMSKMLDSGNFNLSVSPVIATANPEPTSSVRLGDAALKNSVKQRLDGKLIDSHVTPSSRIGQGRAALARCCGPLLSIITSTTPKAPTILGFKRLTTKDN